MPSQNGSGWPMVGRSDEVRQALTALGDAAEFLGVVLIGDSGVGKSTLARALAEILESRGLNVRFVLCTETARAVPLGAFYWLTTLATASELRRHAGSRAKSLRAGREPRRCRRRRASARSVVGIVGLPSCGRWQCTIDRDDQIGATPVPDPVLALWKDQLLLTVRVEAFTRQQTELLARSVLGGEVATELIDGLQDRTAGNPLLLRGLLIPGRENGVLGAHRRRLATSRHIARRPATLRSP